MANTTYIGREASIVITPNGGSPITVGVVDLLEFTVENELITVPAVGAFVPVDIKEGQQNVKFNGKRAFIDSTFWARITRDTNGYLTPFTLVVTTLDKSAGGAGPFPTITHTLTGCRGQSTKGTVPAKGGILMDEIVGEAISWARTVANGAA
ncbi:MAG: hypothetical protein LUO93_09350 [Methanomicrobiales archaeon]|nr:hypothetical protein [Methanomicrobiales archaeon]